MATQSIKTVRVLALSAILTALAFLVSQSVGLGAGGFDTEFILQQFSFYMAGFIYLGIILMLFFAEKIIKKGDVRYGDSLAYASQGESPSLGIFKKVSSFQLFLGSVIIFGFLGLGMVVTNQTTLTGLKVLHVQQFTPVGSILYSSLLIPISETFGAAAVIALAMFTIRWYARKNNWSKANFTISTLFGSLILVTIYWVINHLLHYGGDDLSLTVVAGFGFFGALITILSGSFIPFWVLHLMNNLFFDLRRNFDSDLIVIYTVAFLVMLVVLYVYLYIIRKKKKNNSVPVVS